RRENRPDSGRRPQGSAPGHRQGVRGRGAEESVLRQGAEVTEGVRVAGGAARAEDPAAYRRGHRALLEEVATGIRAPGPAVRPPAPACTLRATGSSASRPRTAPRTRSPR